MLLQASSPDQLKDKRVFFLAAIYAFSLLTVHVYTVHKFMKWMVAKHCTLLRNNMVFYRTFEIKTVSDMSKFTKIKPAVKQPVLFFIKLTHLTHEPISTLNTQLTPQGLYQNGNCTFDRQVFQIWQKYTCLSQSHVLNFATCSKHCTVRV